jgi:hypothetical protein
MSDSAPEDARPLSGEVRLRALIGAIVFTDDALIVKSLFGRRRVPWSAVRSVTFDEITDSDTDAVVGRVIIVRYRRYPDQPLPEMPARFGEFREWNRAHFRSVRLPLHFPPLQTDDSRRDKRPSRLARRRERMRAILLRELTARGYDLSSDS